MKEPYLRSIEIKELQPEYKVEKLTPYQYRINDRLDVYPTRCKWHDIKTSTRGRYEHGKLFKVLNEIFT